MRYISRIAFALLLLLAASTVTTAQTVDDVRRRNETASLRGLPAVLASVWVVAPAPGLDPAEIERAVVARLVRLGVPVLKASEPFKALLSVVVLAKYDKRLNVYAVSLTVEVQQPAIVARTDDVEFPATWTRRDVMITDAGFRELREAMGQRLDEFAADLLRANTGDKPR